MNAEQVLVVLVMIHSGTTGENDVVQRGGLWERKKDAELHLEEVNVEKVQGEIFCISSKLLLPHHPQRSMSSQPMLSTKNVPQYINCY